MVATVHSAAVVVEHIRDVPMITGVPDHRTYDVAMASPALTGPAGTRVVVQVSFWDSGLRVACPPPPCCSDWSLLLLGWLVDVISCRLHRQPRTDHRQPLLQSPHKRAGLLPQTQTGTVSNAQSAATFLITFFFENGHVPPRTLNAGK